jgi:biotin synthase
MDVVKLAREIMNGRRLKRGEDLSFFLTCDLTELRRGADEIRKHFCGNEMDLCTIINGRSGHCSENCKYCAQSAHQPY